MTLFLSVLLMSGCSSEFGDKMAKAGMNTVMCMATVFAMLIFIAFIISLFKYVGKLEAIVNRKEVKAAQPAQTVSAPEETEEDEEIDDLELVAVITAAIAASLGTSPDGLIVRSIRRKNSNRW